MTEKRYKKWEDVINPGLERSRIKKQMGSLEEEIAKTIDMSRENDEEPGDIREGRRGDQPTSEEKRDEEHRGTVVQTAMDRTTPVSDQNHAPVRENVSRRSNLFEKSRDPRLSNFQHPGMDVNEGDLTEEELRIKREKKKAIERAMNEFVSWKESLK